MRHRNRKAGRPVRRGAGVHRGHAARRTSPGRPTGTRARGSEDDDDAACRPRAPSRPAALHRGGAARVASGVARRRRRSGRSRAASRGRSAARSEPEPVPTASTSGCDRLIRDVPDFPQPGVVFKDITPLLADHDAFSGRRRGAGRRPAATPTATSSSTRSSAWRPAGSSWPRRSRWPSAPGSSRSARPASCPGATHAVSYALEYGEATLEVHQDGIAPGDRVLLVDDVLATGGTADATRQLVERCGGTVHAFAVLMELSFLPGRDAIGDLPAAQPADGLTRTRAARRLASRVDDAGAACGRGTRSEPALERARLRRRPSTSHRSSTVPRRRRSRRPPDAGPAGPDGHQEPVRQPGPRAAVPRGPGQPPQGRPGAARAGLPHRRASPRHPDAQERRPLHHPPARGRPRSWPTSA